MTSPPHWAPKDNVVQSFFSCIVLKFLVCFTQSLVVLWLLSHIFWCHFPFDRLKNDREEQFWNHYLREQHKLFFHFTTISHRVIKSRMDDSIHSRSSASKVESRWHHWRCEFVTAMFFNHLGFCNKNNRKKGTVCFNCCLAHVEYRKTSPASSQNIRDTWNYETQTFPSVYNVTRAFKCSRPVIKHCTNTHKHTWEFQCTGTLLSNYACIKLYFHSHQYQVLVKRHNGGSCHCIRLLCNRIEALTNSELHIENV